MAKYENIRALAKKQLQAVTESSDRWKAFLRTAAIAYNYSFPNQLLIHEQSPTATAVADIAYWNNNAGRWVKRGAHGIAVFDTRANSSRLRYLFDISDTIPRAEIPEALPWVITDQNWRPVWDKIVADNHADSIQSALLMLSTSCVAQRSAMFTTALGKAIDGSSLQWAKPDEQRQLFIQLITQSCLYMAALRCGVDTARLDLSALESVNQFDTNRITLCLGSACQQAARPLMQQIGTVGFIRHDMYLELWEGNYLTKTAQVNLTWDAVAAKIADLIEQGRLMVPIKATPVQQQMEQLTLTPEDSEVAGLPSHEQQAKSIDLAAEVKKWNKPIIDASGKYITEQDITDVLCRGSGFEDGKFRIQQYLSAQVLPIEEDQARWLKKKYGIGGGTWFFRDGGRGFLNHMGKNLEITRRTEDSEYRRVLKWKEVAQARSDFFAGQVPCGRTRSEVYVRS